MEETKKYTGNKMSRLKAMLSVGIMTGALMFTPGIVKDVQAAGSVHKNNQITQQQNVKTFKPSAQQLNKINKSIKNFENQRNNINHLNENANKFKSTGNNFRDSLRTDNPDSEYYQHNRNNSQRGNVQVSNTRITNTRTHGDVKIGQIDDGFDR